VEPIIYLQNNKNTLFYKEKIKKNTNEIAIHPTVKRMEAGKNIGWLEYATKYLFK
jgi:hypothetical protein